MARPVTNHQPSDDTVTVALRQAARQRRRGDFRRAMQLLKRAAFEEEDNAALWTRYALACMSSGKRDDAKKAFSQAVWLLERAGRERAAQVTQRLSEVVFSGELPQNYTRSGKSTFSPFALGAAGHKVLRPARGKDSWHPYHKSRSRKSKGV